MDAAVVAVAVLTLVIAAQGGDVPWRIDPGVVSLAVIVVTISDTLPPPEFCWTRHLRDGDLVETKRIGNEFRRAEDCTVREPETQQVHCQGALDLGPAQRRPGDTQFLAVAPERTKAQVPGEREP